jgi:hypothetical protein
MHRKTSEFDDQAFFFVGKSTPLRYMNEYDRDHLPLGSISPERLKEYGVSVSIAFFEWYLLNHCDICDCERCGCAKGQCSCGGVTSVDPEILDLDCYDIEKCAEQLRVADMQALKTEYKKMLADKKQKKNTSNEFYYARIKHYKSPERGKKVEHEKYAIIYRDRAYINLSPNERGIMMKVDVEERAKRYAEKYPAKIEIGMLKRAAAYDPVILQKYQRRPKGLPEKTAEAILRKLRKKNPKIELATEITD